MWYGISKQDVFRGLIIFIGMGLFAALTEVICAILDKTGHINYWAITILLLIFPGLWLVLVSVFSTTWLKVWEDRVEWFLWKKIRIQSCPISEITHIGTGLLSAYVIKTKSSKIRLLGLHRKRRSELSNQLMALNPDIENIR